MQCSLTEIASGHEKVTINTIKGPSSILQWSCLAIYVCCLEEMFCNWITARFILMYGLHAAQFNTLPPAMRIFVAIRSSN